MDIDPLNEAYCTCNYHNPLCSIISSFLVRAEGGVVSIMTLACAAVGSVKVVVAMTHSVHATPMAAAVAMVAQSWHLTVPVH